VVLENYRLKFHKVKRYILAVHPYSVVGLKLRDEKTTSSGTLFVVTANDLSRHMSSCDLEI
jgi:hypothetical protein